MNLTQLHRYWFPAKDGWPDEQRGQLWFSGGEEVDAYLKEHFEQVMQTALAGGYADEAAQDSRLAVSRIVALDQLPRNIRRGTAQAFSGDPLALKATYALLESGQYDRLSVSEKVFALMPLEHAEDLAAQEDSIRLFGELCSTAPPEHRELAKNWMQYAADHRDIIVRFGRFPYRNKLLGRTSTPEEAQWLDGEVDTYGQG